MGELILAKGYSCREAARAVNMSSLALEKHILHTEEENIILKKAAALLMPDPLNHSH